jgi:hypothetical protein
VRRRVHVQVGRILFGSAAERKAQSVLQAVGVRHGPDEAASGLQDTPDLGDERVGVAHVLEQLAGDDHVEGLVVEREGLLDVRPTGLDPQLRGLGQRLAVDVEPDDLVPLEVRPGQRAVAATEIEDPPPGAPDQLPEERGASPP